MEWMGKIESWKNLKEARNLESRYPGLFILFRALPISYQKEILLKEREKLVHASWLLVRIEKEYSYLLKSEILLSTNRFPWQWINKIRYEINNIQVLAKNMEWMIRYLSWIHNVTKDMFKVHLDYKKVFSSKTFNKESNLGDNNDGVFMEVHYDKEKGRVVIRKIPFNTRIFPENKRLKWD